MKLSSRVIMVTVIFTVVAFMFNGNAPIGSMIWPPDAHGPGPTAAQLPFFMVLTLITSVAFGLGVSFLLFGWPLVKEVSPTSRPYALGMYLAVAWLLVSWVPHENLHIAGPDMQQLLYIEYGFHVTLMAAGLVSAWTFSHFVRQARNSSSAKRIGA